VYSKALNADAMNAFPFFNKCGGSAAGHWNVVAIITPLLLTTQNPTKKLYG